MAIIIHDSCSDSHTQYSSSRFIVRVNVYLLSVTICQFIVTGKGFVTLGNLVHSHRNLQKSLRDIS